MRVENIHRLIVRLGIVGHECKRTVRCISAGVSAFTSAAASFDYPGWTEADRRKKVGEALAKFDTPVPRKLNAPGTEGMPSLKREENELRLQIELKHLDTEEARAERAARAKKEAETDAEVRAFNESEIERVKTKAAENERKQRELIDAQKSREATGA